MLATNIEAKVRETLKENSKNGWLRASQCAKLYANGNDSEETKFYRWRKQVEKGKVEGFQVLKLPDNISFIGLDSADPKILEVLSQTQKKSKDKKEHPTPGEMAIKHFQYRGTPEGGDNRYFRYMFDEE